ncbi:Hint domain-containing protein [Leisingera sp. S232]|uniref:Hint domain-containing protein n=2 Tax=Leisingera sp. S232 TaxID=3415132 RepID=UPI003C7AB453
MALTSIEFDGGGVTGTFTDIAGQEVTVSASVSNSNYTAAHGATSAGHVETGGVFGTGATNTYHFSGDGVNGLAVQIGASEGTDVFDFVVNGVDVNLQEMIDAGEAQLVHPQELPFTPYGPSNDIATVNSNGDLTGDSSAPGTSSYADAMPIISFNIPVTSISITNNGLGSTEYIDIYLDSEAAPCFTRDTLIDTDQGEVAVQDLTPGMMVRTRDNGFQPVRWIGMTATKDRAVRIKAGAMGNSRDLVVSPRHRMVLEGWQLEMLFDHDEALVTALELVNDDTILRDEFTKVEYYHVMFDQHEVIYAEGAATESFHPDQPTMGSMDAAAREEIFALFPELREGTTRAEAAPNLSPVQAAYVGKHLDAFIG